LRLKISPYKVQAISKISGSVKFLCFSLRDLRLCGKLAISRKGANLARDKGKVFLRWVLTSAKISQMENKKL
jgi:hypothetical protein